MMYSTPDDFSSEDEKVLDALVMGGDGAILLRYLRHIRSELLESSLAVLSDDAAGGQRGYLKCVGVDEIIGAIESRIQAIKESRKRA